MAKSKSKPKATKPTVTKLPNGATVTKFVDQPTIKVTAKTKASAKVTTTVAKVDGRKTRDTMSRDARECIAGGMTKDEVYAHLVKNWKLPPEKKWYVNWYFSDARRRGLIPQIKKMGNGAVVNK